MWKMGCEMERSSNETLSEDKQGKISPTMGNHNTQEASLDTLGYVVVSENSTSLADWCDCDRQSPLSKLQNK